MYQELLLFFENIGTRLFREQLSPLKELVEKSNMPMLYNRYVGQLFFYCFLSINLFLVYFLYLFLALWQFSFTISIISSVILTATITSAIATIFYLYPFYLYNKQANDIERNMPLGIAYMSIISRSGVPPEKTFKYVAESKNFGEFAKECERIYKYIYLVGKDIISSTKEVALRSPSEKFKDFLLGFVSTILSGGDLNLYLSEESKKGMDMYKAKQQKYTSVMGFLADIYIVALFIAPLVLVIVLTAFSLIEPTFMAFEIKFLVQIVTYIFVPAAGIVFLFFLSSIRL